MRFGVAAAALAALTLAVPAAAQENAVEVMKAGGALVAATEGLVLVVQDKLGTGEASRAVLKMTAGWNARIGEQTLVEITPGGIAALDREMMTLGKGQVFFYSR